MKLPGMIGPFDPSVNKLREELLPSCRADVRRASIDSSQREYGFRGVPWEWDEIKRDWLAGSSVAASPDEVVAAFDRVEATFGPDWINGSREEAGGVSRGSLPTLHVVTLGQLMAPPLGRMC